MELARTDSSGWPWPLGVTSHLPSKHCGAVLFFPWEKTSFKSRCPWPKLGIHLQNSVYPSTAPRQNLPGPWLPEGQLSTAFETLGLCFSSCGTEPSFSSSCPWPKLEFGLQNSIYPRIAARQKLPRQKGLAGLGLWWPPFMDHRETVCFITDTIHG